MHRLTLASTGADAEQPANANKRQRAADDDADDLSGGDTDVSPTPEERAAALVERARVLLERDDADAAASLNFVIRAIVELLQRRERDLSAETAAQLRRYVQRLQEQIDARDVTSDGTQPPDEFLPDDDNMAAESPPPPPPSQPDASPSQRSGGAGGGGGGFDDGGGFYDDGDDDRLPEPSGSAELLFQLADDLESDDDDDDMLMTDDEPPTAPGPATQLEDGMSIDDADPERNSRTRRLLDLRDKAVALLREVPVGGTTPPGLRDRARDLRRRVGVFASASETARRILAALAELLAMPEAAAESGAAAGSGAAAPPPPGELARPKEPAIVGRSTDVEANGTRRQSFLLFEPPNKYNWQTEVGMRADSRLLPLLTTYAAGEGNVGDDPSGNGFVIAILDARGPAVGSSSRQFRVRWTVEPHVPVKHAEEWMLQRKLVTGAQAMGVAFDQRGDGDDAESDDDADDDDGPPPPPDSEPSQPGAVVGGGGGGRGRPSALQWDPSAGRPRLSLRRAVANHASGYEWTVDALIEYTLTRQWALMSRTPPSPGNPGAPTIAQLTQLGQDLFSVNEKALSAAFKREREQERLERAEDGEGDDGGDDDEGDDDGEDDDVAAFALWRAARETELKDEATARWALTRQQGAADLATLRNQMAALKAVRAAGGDVGAMPDDVIGAIGDDDIETLVRAWKAAGADWPRRLSRPRLRLPGSWIRDFLTASGRSAVARGFLKLQRDVHSAARAQQRRDGVYGSAYGSTWPAAPTATSTPADHVTPTRWMEGGTRLLLEAGDPAQIAASTVLCTLAQNSAKGDDALALFSVAGEAGRAGQGVYAPSGVSVSKREMLARTVVWVWCLHPLISNKKRSVGIGRYSQSTGCATFGRAWENGRFKTLAQTQASGFEQRIQLLSLGIGKWQVGNPLTFDPTLLLDADTSEMLRLRFKGEDAIPQLVDAALQAGVAMAPL